MYEINLEVICFKKETVQICGRTREDYEVQKIDKISLVKDNDEKNNM